MEDLLTNVAQRHTFYMLSTQNDFVVILFLYNSTNEKILSFILSHSMQMFIIPNK